MKILMLPKAPDATMYFRTSLPAKYLKEAGHEVRICYADPIAQIPGSGIKEADVMWADVIVFQRPASEFALGAAQQIKERLPEKLLLADYDDDYTAVPRWNPGYPFIKETEPYWRGMIPLMDGLIVSTPTLAESLTKLTKSPVRVIRNGFDFEMFDSLLPMDEAVDIIAPALDSKKQLQTMYSVKSDQWNEMMKDRTVIAWAGSRFHYSDLDILPEEMKEACAQNDNIVFLFVGYLQGNIVPSVPVNRLFVTGGRSPIENFYRVMKSLKIDFLMAPLHANHFNAAKSNVKIIEAMALKALPICSEFDPYMEDLRPSDPELLELWDEHEDEVYGGLVGYKRGDWARAFVSCDKELRSDPDEILHAKRANDMYCRTKHHAALRTPEYVSFFEEMLKVKGVK